MQTRTLDDVRFVGNGLQRPECVLATRRGTLYGSDREGYAMVAPDGAVTRVRAGNAPEHSCPTGSLCCATAPC